VNQELPGDWFPLTGEEDRSHRHGTKRFAWYRERRDRWLTISAQMTYPADYTLIQPPLGKSLTTYFRKVFLITNTEYHGPWRKSFVSQSQVNQLSYFSFWSNLQSKQAVA
jgi:hypothetical protein